MEVIKEYYNYSNEKAKEALTVLSKSQIAELRKELDKGGLNARNKRISRGDAT